MTALLAGLLAICDVVAGVVAMLGEARVGECGACVGLRGGKRGACVVRRRLDAATVDG